MGVNFVLSAEGALRSRSGCASNAPSLFVVEVVMRQHSIAHVATVLPCLPPLCSGPPTQGLQVRLWPDGRRVGGCSAGPAW